MTGWRPIMEIMKMDFSMCAFGSYRQPFGKVQIYVRWTDRKDAGRCENCYWWRNQIGSASQSVGVQPFRWVSLD